MDISGKDRVRNYFSNSSNDDENFIADLFLNDANEADLKEIARNHWDTSSEAELDLQHILNQVHFKINTSFSPKTFRHRILSGYSRVAAVILIPLLTAGIYFWSQTSDLKNSYAEINASKGARAQFVLPDGTRGYLNGGSELKYKTNFRNKRVLTLNGEGYFHVVKDKDHPFTVQTKHADIQVLGTQFAVCAYEKDNEVITTLEEGSVNVLNKQTKSLVTLVPGEQNRINTNTGRMEVRKVNTELYTSWKEEILRFDNELFAEVVKKMERWYGVTIVLDKNLKYSENYTMTIRTESLRELLQLLKITTPMRYEINNDTVYIYPPKKLSE